MDKKLTDPASDINEKLFRTMFDAMPQLGWTARGDGYIDFYNKGWFEYTGTDFEQMRGWGWELVHDPKYLPEVTSKWKHSLETGTPFEMKFPIRDRNGNFRWFLTRVNPVVDETGTIYRWVGINTDIQQEFDASSLAEGVVAERTKELEASQERLKSISDVLSEFVGTGDLRRTSERMLALAIEETDSEYGFIGATIPGGPQGMLLRVFADLGFNWSDTENRDLYEKIIADYETKGYIEFPFMDNLFGWPILHGKTLIANEPQLDSRRSGRQPKGHPPLTTFLGIPILKGNEVVGTIGLANRAGGYDTNQVAAVELLGRAASVIYESYRRTMREQSLLSERDIAREKLEESNRSLLDLAYTVSHELQAPLQVIKSELSLLSVRYGDKLGTDADEFISDSVKAAGAVERMIDDLWEYARIDRPHIKFEPVNLSALLDKTLVSLEPQITAKKASLHRTTLPSLSVERRQLANVFRQLILNAITFNNSSSPRVDVIAVQMVNEWEFSFIDNGIGFEPAESEEIFRMFRKLDKDSPGIGMGLAIVRRIIEFHGGRIWATSNPGVGTKVTFTLPISPVR